jgi:hypothetical protein
MNPRLCFAVTIAALFALQGCAVNKELVPIGGSRADASVTLAFEHDGWERPQVNQAQALTAARAKCTAWGYSDAQPFGGSTTECTSSSKNPCSNYRVTVQYQCLGTPGGQK